MTRPSILSLVLASSALLAIPTAASAEGKTDRARKAIAAAQAKIDAVNIVGAAYHGEVSSPRAFRTPHAERCAANIKQRILDSSTEYAAGLAGKGAPSPRECKLYAAGGGGCKAASSLAS